MLWTRALSHWLAAIVVSLLTVSIVLALMKVVPGGNLPTPVVTPLSPPTAKTVPIFATTEPAKNETVLMLQATEREVYGWVAGEKSFAGQKVLINNNSIDIRSDNTFVWQPVFSGPRQLPVQARIDRPGLSSLVAHTTFVPTSAPNLPTVFFITDRSAYRPGHTLQFVAFLRTLLPKGEFEPIRNREIAVSLTSVTKKTRAAHLKLTSDDRGRVTGSYTFSDADALDQYTLTAEGFSGNGAVMLGEYRKSKVALKLKGEVKDGKLSVAFDARDYLDRRVKGTAASYTATIVRTGELAKFSLNPSEFAKPENGPPDADQFEALPDDERLFTLAHGVSAMTFAGLGSRLVSSREGTVPVQADGAAKLELDLRPEWVNSNHAITISGVFTDETGREHHSSTTINLAPNPTRGIRIFSPKELFTTGEKIPVTFTPFGLATNDKPGTTLVVVRLEGEAATSSVIHGSELSGNALVDSGQLPALGNDQDTCKKAPPSDDWKNAPVFDSVKRVVREFVPVANNQAEIAIKDPGAYKLLAVTHLADGSTLQAEIGVVVKSLAKLPGLVLQLDKHEIDAGSRLKGTIHTRFSKAKLLLTLQDSAGVKLMRTLTTGANGIARIDVPLPNNLRYGCSVCVQYPESQKTIHIEQRELFVIPTDKLIQVKTTVPAEVGPGADINLGVQIDRQEETDLIVSVFDESLLGVSGDLSKDIRNFYLGDARGQSRAARDLATTRFSGVTIESLIQKASGLLTDKKALMFEPGLEQHLQDLLSRWKSPAQNLILSDVVTLVRLAGLEVYLAPQMFNRLQFPIFASRNATLADLLRWEKRESGNLKVYISATVVGNVALINATEWVSNNKPDPTDVLDPWTGYHAHADAYAYRGFAIGNGQYGMMPNQYGQLGFNQSGFIHPGGYGISSMNGLPGFNGYYGQLGFNGLAGMMGIGGWMGLRGGMMGMGGGIMGLNGQQGGVGSTEPYAPGGQMGMSFGFNRDFGAQSGVDFPALLPALGLRDDVIRRDFADSAFWSASLRTDKTGKATTTFKLPESLTNWRVVVTAVSSRMHVGTGTARFKSTRSVMVWPMLPRTFTEGDAVRLFGTVHNLTDKEQAFKVHLKAENGQVMGEAEQSVTVPANGSVPVYWTYKAGTKGWTDLLMSATCEAGSDASLKRLPIVAGGVPERQTASGLVGKDDLKIILPADFDPARASITVTVAPTLAADLADTLPYLVDYPYGCVEQTMSRFLPAIRVSQILQQSGISTLKDLELKLPKVVESGQKRLVELQQPDGGWGWQGSGNTHEMMTPYALFGLIQAEEAGYLCPNPTTIQRGMERLRVYLEQMATAWDQPIEIRRQRRGEINDSLFCLWVFAMKVEKLNLDRWWDRIESNIGEGFFSDYGHALALELAAKKGNKRLADKLAAELHKRAQKSLDQIYWTTAGFSRWGDNVTEITAAAMKALVAHDPNDSLIPGILSFFHGTKRGNHWVSTKDTAGVLYALCDYLAAVRAGPAAAGLVKFSVNGIDDGNIRLDAPVSKTAKLTGKTLKPGENLLTVKGQDASGGALVRVVVEYTRGRSAEIPARDHGVKVVRTVSLRGADGTWSELKSGATVPAGSYLKIGVTATPDAGSNLQYALLESPKPAGGETVPVRDKRFPTPAGALSHVLREDREAMTCFHYEQAAGMVAAEYVVLTEFAGEFRIAPARVELMYKPTVGGHSASFVVNVAEKIR